MTLATLLILQEQADEAAGGLGGPFALEPGLIIWTWVVFIALFLMLRKWAFPPIVRVTEQREKKIQHQLEQAEQANAEAQKALGENQKLLASAKDEAQGILNEAKGLAQMEREQLLAKARSEQQQLLDRAKQEIAGERDRALAELRREAVDLSLAAASKLIQARLDTAGDKKIVEDYLASLESSG